MQLRALRHAITTRVRRDASHLAPEAVIDAHLADPDFPALVSFPRTGSHWLRMVMELTFGLPSLRRTFFEHRPERYTCIHLHDLALQARRRSVIYLYRDPVDTVFSQLRYHDLPSDDAIHVRHWATRYALHLRTWLVDEDWTDRKTVIRYRELREDPVSALARIGDHLGLDAPADRVTDAVARIDRDAVARRTTHDPAVVTQGQRYADARERFRRESAGLVIECMVQQGLPGEGPIPG